MTDKFLMEGFLFARKVGVSFNVGNIPIPEFDLSEFNKFFYFLFQLVEEAFINCLIPTFKIYIASIIKSQEPPIAGFFFATD